MERYNRVWFIQSDVSLKQRPIIPYKVLELKICTWKDQILSGWTKFDSRYGEYLLQCISAIIVLIGNPHILLHGVHDICQELESCSNEVPGNSSHNSHIIRLLDNRRDKNLPKSLYSIFDIYFSFDNKTATYELTILSNSSSFLFEKCMLR